jgi:hypothetical protein
VGLDLTSADGGRKRDLDGIDLIDGVDGIDLRTLLTRVTSLGRDVNVVNDVKRCRQERQRCQFCPLSTQSILSTPSMTSESGRRQAAWLNGIQEITIALLPRVISEKSPTLACAVNNVNDVRNPAALWQPGQF